MRCNRFLGVLLALATAACGYTTRTARSAAGPATEGLRGDVVPYAYSPRECADLRNTHRAYGSISILTGSLAGASGVASVIPKDDRSQMAFAITTGVLAAVSAATGFIGKDLGEERANHAECGTGSVTFRRSDEATIAPPLPLFQPAPAPPPPAAPDRR